MDDRFLPGDHCAVNAAIRSGAKARPADAANGKSQPSPWRKQSEEKAPVNIVVLTRDIVKRTKTLHLGQFVADYEEWMPIPE